MAFLHEQYYPLCQKEIKKELSHKTRSAPISADAAKIIKAARIRKTRLDKPVEK